MSKKAHYSIGVDLGGTKILAAIVDEKGNVVAKTKKTTKAEKGGPAVVERIIATLEELLKEGKLDKKHIDAIGIGVPGIIDTKKGVILDVTNIPNMHNVEIVKILQKWRDVPVVLSNDVRVAAVGEQRMGAGKGATNLIAVFVGTGIGGGIIIDGKVYSGSRGSGGEVGHMVVLADGPFAVGAGVRGGIEALASRSAIERDLRAGIAAGRKSALPELMEEKGGALTSSVLAKAVAKNDPLTVETLRRAAHFLGLHAATLVNAFDPQMLIYGGGLIEGLGDWIISQIRDTARMNFINKRDIDKVQFVEAKLGEEAGVVGAALLAIDAAG
jgi:glucokinase